jgi:hypothetical protein
VIVWWKRGKGKRCKEKEKRRKERKGKKREREEGERKRGVGGGKVEEGETYQKVVNFRTASKAARAPG